MRPGEKEPECDPEKIEDMDATVQDHEKRISTLEIHLGVHERPGMKGVEPTFITRKEFEDWAEKKLFPRLSGIENGQTKIMGYITAMGIAAVGIAWLLNSGIFRINH